MQFHLNGFRTGDPAVAPKARAAALPAGDRTLPEKVDVLIVGCGPAGLTLAALLSVFPQISTCIVDQKPGPLKLGQADGVACRSMEMFNAFGFAERVLREAYWVNETSFWSPSEEPGAGIRRTGRIRDTEDGLSEFPHVILNQARVHEFYLDLMRNSPTGLVPHYGRALTHLSIDRPQSPAIEASAYPVTATFGQAGSDGAASTKTVRARYAVGCDGARSGVRRALGLELKGDSASQAWGVMDLLAVTDFPDIRLKAVINSAEHGSIVLIPREGGYLIRLYVEMAQLAAGERVAAHGIAAEDVIATARRVLEPYTLDVKEIAWWSVYEIGQRLCDRFDDVRSDDPIWRQPRVFIAGDACHTHSPKAGQGMNVSMQDAFNLGWKLAAVLRGSVAPDVLKTYTAERQAIAKELIEFDREWATMLSAPLRSPSLPEGVDPAHVQDYFTRSGRYTAGTATCYPASRLIGEPLYQQLAQGFPIGRRFHSAPVVRLGDAKPMQLGHAAQADGRWRLYLFADAGDPEQADSAIAKLCDFLTQSRESPIVRFTPEGTDVDAVIDVRAIVQQSHRALRIDRMPALLLPRKGQYGLVDYEKIFCPALMHDNDVFDLRGLDRKRGCVVIVRPDQYVAHVLPLHASQELSSFFASFMLEQRECNDVDRQSRER